MTAWETEISRGPSWGYKRKRSARVSLWLCSLAPPCSVISLLYLSSPHSLPLLINVNRQLALITFFPKITCWGWGITNDLTKVWSKEMLLPPPPFLSASEGTLIRYLPYAKILYNLLSTLRSPFKVCFLLILIWQVSKGRLSGTMSLRRTGQSENPTPCTQSVVNRIHLTPSPDIFYASAFSKIRI